jgi:prepilin-type N-terminal cleavage/methylation domain-containing protein
MIGVRKGVTLMELLVVLGIFSTTVMLASAIFLQTNAVQRRVILVNAAQSDLRFSFEAMVREVRHGGLDYDYYEGEGGIELPTDRLVVTNPYGQREEFFPSTDSSVCPIGISKCIAVRIDGGQPEAMSSNSFILEDMFFYITPSANPFVLDETSGTYLSDVQPTVTIVVSGRTNGLKPTDIFNIDIQTTVAARTYAR